MSSLVCLECGIYSSPKTWDDENRKIPFHIMGERRRLLLIEKTSRRLDRYCKHLVDYLWDKDHPKLELQEGEG